MNRCEHRAYPVDEKPPADRWQCVLDEGHDGGHHAVYTRVNPVNGEPWDGTVKWPSRVSVSAGQFDPPALPCPPFVEVPGETAAYLAAVADIANGGHA